MAPRENHRTSISGLMTMYPRRAMAQAMARIVSSPVSGGVSHIPIGVLLIILSSSYIGPNQAMAVVSTSITVETRTA